MSRAEIWLGDLLRVFAELEPTGERADAVARLLALRPASASPSARAPGTPGRAGGTPRPAPGPVVVLPPAAPAGGEAAGPSPLPGGALTELVATRTGSAAVQPPPWDAATAPMSAPDPGDPPSPDPILPPLTRRGILSAALATRAPNGPPDLDRILDTLTRGAPLREIPRVQVPTLRMGAQVLVDSWAGMSPYTADRDQLLDGLRRILGPTRMEVLRFAGDPLRRAGAGPRTGWRPWRPPPPGTPVLVLSDLGIGGPPLDAERASVEAWVRFARGARDARCPVVALVPFGPARWPRALADAMLLVHWSERLTAGAVQRAVGRGHGTPR